VSDLGYWAGSLTCTPSGQNGIALPQVSVTFGAVDSNGTAWLLQKVDGWDSPDVQGGGVIAKAGDHGAWQSPQYYAARAITLTLTASAQSQALRDVARAQLQQVVPVSDLAVFQYDEPVPKFAQVRRSGRVTEAYPTLTDVTFTVVLIAPDPRKYAVAQGSQLVGVIPTSPGGGMVVPFTVPFTLDAASPPGSTLVISNGTFETRPTITIKGPITAPAVSNVTYGMTVSFSQLTLAATDQLVIDFLNRVAYLNGVYRPADLDSAWWVLEPGNNMIELSSTSAGSGASMLAEWNDAFV
jgi:hypothetical protein